jgi:hypothetical protein
LAPQPITKNRPVLAGLGVRREGARVAISRNKVGRRVTLWCTVRVGGGVGWEPVGCLQLMGVRVRNEKGRVRLAEGFQGGLRFL